MLSAPPCPMTDAITFRAIRPEDEEFLYHVYAGTRTDELAPLGWDHAQQEAFLRMQFNAQHRYFQTQFADASFQIILQGERAIGRLYVDRRTDEIGIVDIALLPEYRNAGIGSRLLKDLFAEAARAGKPVRIHVEQHNPAVRLYERLGFVRIGPTGVYFLMEWRPAALLTRTPDTADECRGQIEP
jgi:ribosomal protein S18 acetylase RimI-like enzyme